jgi:hypothetical protein
MASPEYRQFIVALKARVTAARVGWSRIVLLNRIKAGAYERAVTEKETPTLIWPCPSICPSRRTRCSRAPAISNSSVSGGETMAPAENDYPGWETIAPAGRRLPRLGNDGPGGKRLPQRGCVR